MAANRGATKARSLDGPPRAAFVRSFAVSAVNEREYSKSTKSFEYSVDAAESLCAATPSARQPWPCRPEAARLHGRNNNNRDGGRNATTTIAIGDVMQHATPQSRNRRRALPARAGRYSKGTHRVSGLAPGVLHGHLQGYSRALQGVLSRYPRGYSRVL